MACAAAFSTSVGLCSKHATVSTSSFTSALSARGPQAPFVIVPKHRRARVRMGSEKSIREKSAKVDRVKALLRDAQLLFSIPLPGLSVANVFKFRHSLPQGTTAMTVKNTLMRRALADSEWLVAGDLTRQSSVWVFVKEDIKGSVNAYKELAKELKREGLIGGVMEGVLYDQAGINAIAALPSKIELIEKVARLVKMVPTKVALGVKAVPQKVARAIKLAVADEDEVGKAVESAE